MIHWSTDCYLLIITLSSICFWKMVGFSLPLMNALFSDLASKMVSSAIVILANSCFAFTSSAWHFFFSKLHIVPKSKINSWLSTLFHCEGHTKIFGATALHARKYTHRSSLHTHPTCILSLSNTNYLIQIIILSLSNTNNVCIKQLHREL